MELACLQDTQGLTSHSASTYNQSFTARLNDTLKRSFSQEWMMEVSRLHQSGMTLQHLTESSLKGWLTLFTEDSPVRTLAQQERVLDWKASVQAFFTKSYEFAKKHPLYLFSLKTWRQSEPEAQLKFKKNWPASAMILDLACYPLPRLVQFMNETDGFVLLYGEMLLTPTAQNYGSNQGGAAGRTGKVRYSLETMARKGLLPTPTATDPNRTYHYKPGTKEKVYSLEGLARQGLLPTPSASEHKYRLTGNSQQSNCLEARARTGKLSNEAGPLSPQFVEQMMFLPIGWTELKPWVTESFLCKSRRRLKS